MNKITDVACNDDETVEECYSGNAQVLATDTDALLLQLSKDGIRLFVEEENVP